MENNSKVWLWVILAVIVIGGLWWWYKSPTSAPKPAVVTTKPVVNQPVVPKVPTKEVAKDQLPDNWPSDVPMEAGAKVTVNYQNNAQDGSVQLVRTFVSAKTMDQNAKIYTDYFASAGFKLSGSIDQPTFKSYAATKGNEMLQVVIQQNAKTKAVSVNITVTFATKAF